MNKWLFIDCDGVLNNRKTLSAGNSPWLLDDNCLLLLKDIVDKTNCQLVLSSTWRCYEQGKSVLKQHFRKHEIPLWISQTPDLNNQAKAWGSGNHHPRKEEISQWLLDNQVDQVNDRIAILDDDFDACLVFGWFFQTFFSVGLNRAIADNVIKHLNKDE